MKRRNFLINPKFQLTFIAWIVGIALIEIFIFYASNLYFLKHYLDLGKQVGFPKEHIFFSFLRDQYVQMNWIFLGTAIVSFIAIFFTGLLLSHRIAGPMYRLRKHLDDIADGKPLGEIKFRTMDYFAEVGKAYNRHLKALRDRNQ